MDESGSEKIKEAREAREGRGTYKTARRELFISTLVQYGFIKAKRIAGYNDVTASRLLNNKWIKSEIMARIQKELEELKITRQSLVQKYLDFADNATSESVKNNALQFLIESSDDKPANSDQLFIPAMRMSRLEPSKAVGMLEDGTPKEDVQ
jgi:hypothetical protein